MEFKTSPTQGADPHLLVFLNMREVQRLAGGKSRSTIWRWSKDSSNKFPAPVKIGANSIGWAEEDIIAWRNSLMDREV
tara:strand:+ start:378 stop:611 length:234 start_codon:yes stop_codon:yes gene_type:complete